jgi:hypothetical protein
MNVCVNEALSREILRLEHWSGTTDGSHEPPGSMWLHEMLLQHRPGHLCLHAPMKASTRCGQGGVEAEVMLFVEDE